MSQNPLDNPDFASDASFEALMSSISTVYALRPGRVLTQDDFEAIQHFDKHFRDEEASVVDAYHRGYEQGLRDGGSSDIVDMQRKLDEKFCQHGVDKALRKFAESRLTETEQHIRDFITALDRGYLDCRDDSAFINALRTIAVRSGYEPQP